VGGFVWDICMAYTMDYGWILCKTLDGFTCFWYGVAWLCLASEYKERLCCAFL